MKVPEGHARWSELPLFYWSQCLILHSFGNITTFTVRVTFIFDKTVEITNHAYFLAVVFKKQEISRQVYCFTISILIAILVLTTRGATTAQKLKVWNWFRPCHCNACCLLGYARTREPINERRSHQNARFSIWVFKNFPGVIGYPRTSTEVRGDPALTSTPSLACGRAQVPQCWVPNLAPQLLTCGCSSVLSWAWPC